MGFLVTLPSNSSEKYYLTNTISNFKTYLPQEISLDSDYEVALTEIQYTNTFYNVNEDSRIELQMNLFSAENLQIQEVNRSVVIKAGYYENLSELLDVCKEKIRDKLPNDIQNGFDLRYMSIQRKVKIIIPHSSKDLKVKFPPTLQAILGFDDDYIETNTIAPRAADLSALVHSMYIYSNILSNRIVGDSLVPLLRPVAIHGTHNEYVMENFFHLQYVPLQLRNFRTIEIDLRNSMGHPMPFHSGEAILTLHFRRVIT